MIPDDTRNDPAAARLDRLRRGADLCVKCGLCLQACPTYGLERNEADSPRGRIALMQGLIQGRLNPTPGTLDHLAGCLACRACEAVCPSGVPYGALIDDIHGELVQRGAEKGSVLNAVLAIWTTRLGRLGSFGLAMAGVAARGLRRMGLSRSRLVRLAALQGRRPARPPAFGIHPATAGGRVGAVALHLGCVSRLVEPAVLSAAVRLANAAGYDVHVPEGQGCCGAIHLHGGFTHKAHALATRNVAAFGTTPVDGILSCASGCGAVLAAYPLSSSTAGNGDGPEPGLGAPVWDVSRFLLDHGAGDLRFRPLKARAVVHDPCTLRNVMGQHEAVPRLLRLIPGLEVIALEGNDRCCGSAGTHLVARPVTADRLARPKMEAARAADADYLVTSNVGCALNLRLNHPAADQRPRVIHPVELLAGQLVMDS